jgi:hypothetical protein
MDHVQSVITLYSSKEGVKPEHCKEKTDSPPLLLFPHVMTKQREVNHDSEIFETFKQEEIEDKEGIENVVTDHLSRLTIDSTSDITPIDDYFPDESSLSVASIPWSANIDNFLASGFLLAYWNT